MSQETKQLRADHNRTVMQNTKKDLVETLGRTSQDFCAHSRFMMNMLWLRNQKNEDITDLKRRITIATNSNPVTIIEIAGPQFFKYRESLKARQVDFFLNKEYMDEIKEVQTVHDVKGDTSSADEVIKTIKTTFSSFKDAEKTIILNKAIEMLSFYTQYLIATKKLAEFKESN